MSQRRTVVTAAVAAAAGLAGYGWLNRQGAVTPADSGSGSTKATGAADPSAPGVDIWTLRFEQPDGGELDMARLRGRTTLVNFWATWCPPCVKELPMLDTFHRDHLGRGWQVVGLAIDGPTPVRQFLAKAPVAFPVGLAGLDGIELGKALGNANGGLPFTVVFDRSGSIVERKLGELTLADLTGWAQRH
jgi:thiol-disulfide isomerase/thioredoxin